MPRALNHERGQEQDASAATGAPRFSEDETVLSFAVTTHLFQCRFSALTLAGIQALVMLDDERQPLRAVKTEWPLRRVTGAHHLHLPPGDRGVERAGVLELELGRLPF